MSEYEFIVDLIEDNKLVEAENMILVENDEAQVVRRLGDGTMLQYLMRLEEFFDGRDVYLFDGWEDAEIVKPPEISKFWVIFMIKLGPKADLNGAKRITNDKEAQNKVEYKKLTDGSYILRLKILRNILDELEKRNQERSEDTAEEEIKLG